MTSNPNRQPCTPGDSYDEECADVDPCINGPYYCLGYYQGQLNTLLEEYEGEDITSRKHRLYGHIIREHLNNGNRQAALDSLKSLGSVAAYKQLAATKFEEERIKSSPNWRNVYQYLKKIPTNTHENTTFYNFYDNLINAYQNGRSIYDLNRREISYLEGLEDDTTVTVSSHARTYLRHAEDMRFRYFPCYDHSQSHKMNPKAENDDEASDTMEQKAKQRFDVYPNPFNNTFVISMDLTQEELAKESVTISVMDPLGKAVITREVSSSRGKFTIDANHFAQGVYIVRLSNDHKPLQQKRIVKIE